MDAHHQYKEKIGSYKAKTILILVVLVGFLLGVGVSIYNQFKQLQTIPDIGQTQAPFKDNEFTALWEQLQQQTVPVDNTGPTQFDGDLGKLEPFE